MPSSPEELILFDYSSDTASDFPLPETYEKEPYDSSYWSSNEIKTILIPWLPYFSYCTGHGRHIILYDLLESTDCDLIK